MKYILSILVLFVFASCNTKYNIIDTGLARGRFPGNMYEYLMSNHYDWDSTRLMIERGGLTDLFEGHREGYDSITFFGPTNHSIRRWMLENKYKQVADIPEDQCRDLILRHVVKGKYMRDEIARGKKGVGSNIGEGGQIMRGGMDNEFWIYSFRETYNNVPETGAVALYILSLTGTKLAIDVASTNIEPDNGVVHSLSYYYRFGTL